MPNTEGFARGFATVNYPGVDNGIPLLSSFYFRFERSGSSTPIDNHINSVRVLPAGQSVDLSPNADLSPSAVPPGKLELTYADKDSGSSNDRYFFKVAHHNLPSGARRFQFRDLGCTGKCEQVLPKPPGPILPGVQDLFVLVGFKVFFTGNRDHHLDGLSVFEDNGKLTVEFNDRNDDDVFGYLVDYALVRTIGQNVQLGEEGGTATGAVRVPVPQGQKVIRGFRFDLRSSDHEVREIGVLTNNNNLEVFYTDAAGDDRFQWFVRWATITPQVLEQ